MHLCRTEDRPGHLSGTRLKRITLAQDYFFFFFFFFFFFVFHKGVKQLGSGRADVRLGVIRVQSVS